MKRKILIYAAKLKPFKINMRHSPSFSIINIIYKHKVDVSRSFKELFFFYIWISCWNAACHLSNIAISFVEISNRRTNNLSINLCNIPWCGDVSLEEDQAPSFPIELHLSMVFVQPVDYTWDTFCPCLLRKRAASQQQKCAKIKIHSFDWCLYSTGPPVSWCPIQLVPPFNWSLIGSDKCTWSSKTSNMSECIVVLRLKDLNKDK